MRKYATRARPVWKKPLAIIVLLLGGMVMTGTLDAAVTVSAFQPPFDVLSGGSQTWASFRQGMVLDAGDQMKTGPGGSAELLFEDGSTLYLEADTQLSLHELEFSQAQKIRVSRLKLAWGAIVAKAAPLNFEKNVFEVQTDTVVAGFKFSGMRIVAKRLEALEGNDEPHTTLYPLEGVFDVQQYRDGLAAVICALEAAPSAGLAFALTPNASIHLKIAQTREQERIEVQSNLPLAEMRAFLSELRNILRLENMLRSPTITVEYQKHRVEVEQQSAAIFGFAPSQAEQQINVGARGIHGVFIFRRNLEIPPLCWYLLGEQGIILVNGQAINPGTPTCLPIEESPAPFIGEPETPHIPPAPADVPSGAAGTPAPAPTPTRTPHPTPTPGQPRPGPVQPRPTPEPPPTPPPVPTEPIGSPILP